MSKPNTYLQLRAAQQQIQQLQRDIWMSKGFTIQQCLDIAQIALHEEFGFGPTYQSRFGNAFRKAFVEYAELCLDDGKDDADIVYTKEVLDRALRAACGDDILPFDDRYAQDKLYFRDSREEWKENKNKGVPQ